MNLNGFLIHTHTHTRVSLFILLLLIFSPLLLKSQNPYTINIDACGGQKLIMNIYHDIEPADDCGELKLTFDYEILQGAEIFAAFDSVVWGDFNNLGEYIWQWTLDEPVYLTPVTISKIDLHITFHFICSDEKYHFTISNTWSPSSTVCDSYCASSISYCDMTMELPPDHDPGFDWSMGEIVGFKYSLNNYTSIDVRQNMNNDEGIFNFPYYTHVSQQCDFPPNIYHFVEDMNKFLNLANTSNNPDYSRLFGTAQWSHTYGVNGDNCKLNLFFVNTGVRIDLLWVDQYEFNKPECKIGKLFFWEKPANTNHNFPVIDDCFYNTYQNENFVVHEDEKFSDNYYLLNNKNETNFLYCFPTITSSIVKIYSKESLDIEILDVNGRFITKKDFTINSDNTVLDLSEFKAGLYFVKLINKKSGDLKIKKIIKQ